MAATVLEDQATEDSTYVVNGAFADEDGNPVVPNAISWSLEDEDGNVINGRAAVAIVPPAAAVDIVLQGDDLDPGTCDVRRLFLTIAADYDSSLGAGLPLIGQCLILVGALEPSD